MSDDIVTRLRKECEGIGCWHPMFPEWEKPCPFCLAADEIEQLRANRDRWREIAAKLISGAEHQLDELRFVRIPLNNPKWVEAWQAYDEAVRGE